jgi:hypothetical protein
MTMTDTETEYGAFVASTESSLRRRRVAWGIGAVAAAAAIVIAVLLGGLPGLFWNKADPLGPAVEPTTEQIADRTPEEQIATGFVNALAAYDAAVAAQDLAVSETDLHIWPGEPTLREGLGWAQAAGFKILPKSCVADTAEEVAGYSGDWPPAGTIIVTCDFDWHFLGSDRLGQPPYEGQYEFLVRDDGRIQSASTSLSWYFFGLRQDSDLGMDPGRWRDFVSWLQREHPADVPAMITVGEDDGLFSSALYTDESLALWAEYVDEWVASQQ